MAPPAGDGGRGRRRRRPPHRRAEAVVHRPADGHHTGEQRRASAVAGPVSLDWAGVVDAEGGRRPRRRCRGATREREERWSGAAEEGTAALVKRTSAP